MWGEGEGEGQGEGPDSAEEVLRTAEEAEELVAREVEVSEAVITLHT